MHTRLLRRTCALAVSAALLGTSIAPTFAAPPTTGGPESVQDWFTQGQRFIQRGKQQFANVRRAKNVILFVGDGMGVSTVTAARILDGQLRGMKGEENELFFEKLPYLALSKTYSWDQQTSDSAPTMTAMVTGYKGREGQLSVDHTTTRGECDAAVTASKSLPTILEQAAAAGKSTGVVSTARITHATPAATYAHIGVRDWESDANIRSFETAFGLPANSCTVKDIAAQLVDVSPVVRTSLKVALGGGRPAFYPRTVSDPENTSSTGARRDGRNLTEEWVTTRGGPSSAKYVWNKADFDAINPATTEYALGLFERSHMQYEADRNTGPSGEPSLTEMTDKALRMLKKNPNGFFLHVESGRIDHAHHAGNAQRALLETIEFAKAVKKAYESTDPNDTLILVTADHSHVFTIAGYPARGNPILGLVREVPNVDGDAAILATDALDLPYTTLGYQNGPGWRGTLPTNSAVRPTLTEAQTSALGYLQEAAIPLGSETHAGEEVAIYASGPKAYLVRGTMEQHFIYHVMKDAFGF
jgi:alkaline phosphatase